MEALILIGKILAAIFIFGIIILVHEWGHFMAARWVGIRVNEFAMGMGPTLFKFGKGETVYSLRAFPIGGFCAMEGEDADSDDPRAFGSKKVWQRVVVVVAGAVMNLVLGFVLLVVMCATCIKPEADGRVMFSSTTIAQLAETTPAYETGLRPGDTILKINGKRVVTDQDISVLMQSDEDGVMDMVVRRTAEDGSTQKVTLPGVTFRIVENESGQRYLSYDFSVVGIDRTPWTTITQAAKMEYSIGTLVWRSLGDIVTGKYGLNELAGPVGTVDVIGDAVEGVATQEDIRDGLWVLFMLVAMITINVGIFNLLPLPALDGGRLLFLIIEGVTRRKVNPKYEGWIHAAGLILLLILMVVITFSDVSRLISGG